MTLAGWGLLVTRAQALALPALDVYVADSQIRYLAPLYEAIEAHAWLADASRWQATVLRVRERGRASLDVQAQVSAPGDEQVASMAARFALVLRSEEHTSELQSLMRIPYAVFCLKKKKHDVHSNQIDAKDTPLNCSHQRDSQ